MSDLTKLTIAQARDKLNAGDCTSVQLTQAYLDAMVAGRDLNAYITETPELALERAQQSDDRRAKGESLGSMDGIPVAIKDLFCTEGVLTTAASHILSPIFNSIVILEWVQFFSLALQVASLVNC